MKTTRLMPQMAFFVCLCALTHACRGRVSEKPLSPPNVPAPASRPASMRILFEDGHELAVKEPEIVQQSNPGYVPARYVRVNELRFKKIVTTLGVTFGEDRVLNLSELKSIEYTKNRLNWCITIISLNNGGWLAFEGGTNFDKNGPQFVLDRLTKGFLDRFAGGSLRSEFREYSPPQSGGTARGTYHVRGRVGENGFADGAGDLFDCLRVWDNDHFVAIKKIEFDWQR